MASDNEIIIEQLKNLTDAGIITKEEYEQKIRALNVETAKTYVNRPSSYDEMLKRMQTNKIAYPTDHFNRDINKTTPYSANPYSYSTYKKKSHGIGRTYIGFLILIVIILIVAFSSGDFDISPSGSSEPVKYSRSAVEGDEVYAEVVSIEPYYGVFRDNSNYMQDYTDVVCKCTTNDKETIWMVIPYTTYIEAFDPSAVDTSLNRGKSLMNAPLKTLDSSYSIDSPKKVLFGSPKKLYGEIDKAEDIAENIGSEVGTLVMVYVDYMN